MKLLVYSYFPILECHQAGGAQLVVRDLLLGFAKAGVEITVVCPKIPSRFSVLSHKNICVLPKLKYFESRSLSFDEVIYNTKIIESLINSIDVIWTIDRSFPLQTNKPIVLTLDTISYKNEIDALANYNWDCLVIPSPYLKNVVKTFFDQNQWGRNSRQIKVIPNGIDFNLFRPSDTITLLEKLGLSKNNNYLIFPHRPDPPKGFSCAIAVMGKLQKLGKKYKLLIPSYPFSIGSRKSEANYYRFLKHKIEQLDLSSNIIFHDWIEVEDLPAYFSLGKWCLTLSLFPEGFGLTPIQSISCGTPVISTRGGALRNHFPEKFGVSYVDFDAPDQIVNRILDEDNSLGQQVDMGRNYVQNTYNISENINKYLNCFATVQKTKVMVCEKSQMNQKIKIAPWCTFIGNNTIWHDLQMRKFTLTKLEAQFLAQLKIKGGVDSTNYEREIETLENKGILVKCS